MDSDLGIRVARLERETRWWRGAALTLLAAGVGLVLLRSPEAASGGPAEDVPVSLKAGSFEVVDGVGRMRAQLYANPLVDGAATLRLLDKQGRSVAHLEETGTGAVILSFAVERMRLEAAVAPNGVCNLSLHDGRGEPRLTLSVGKDGGSEISLGRNDFGWPMLSLTAGVGGLPRISLVDKDRKTLFEAPK